MAMRLSRVFGRSPEGWLKLHMNSRSESYLFSENTPKALHLTAIPLRFIAAGELRRCENL
jgi:plasmid maintenance system antidote protein VapI